MPTKTKATHTPGPWFRLSGGILTNTVGPHHSSGENFIGRWSHEPSEANARLIAAAPALLEALDRIAEDTAMSPVQGLIQPTEDEANMMRQQLLDCAAIAEAAIAQATD